MASEGNVSPPGDQDVARRIDSLSRKLDEVNAAAASAKNVGRIMAVLIAVVAIISVVRLIYPFKAIKDNPTIYANALGNEFETSVYPLLKEKLGESFEKTGPVISSLARKQLEKRQPEIVKALDSEARTLLENLKATAGDLWTTRAQAINDKLYDRIASDFPELAKEDQAEKVIGNAHLAVTGAVERFLHDYMKDHIEAITSIEMQIETFPVPSHIKNMTDAELKAAFMDKISTYSMTTLKGGLQPQTKEFLRDLGKED